jgi:4-aminobutyrate aminotransferase-like enzyme
MTQSMSKQEAHQAQHKKYVLSSWAAQGALNAPVAVRGEGRFFYDEDDKRYFDLSAGLVSTNLGHGHPKVVKAIQDQAAKLCYSPTSYFQDKRSELAEALSHLSPWAEGCRTFFTTGGAEANDDAIRVARALTGRFKILATYRSYHGSTGTAMQLRTGVGVLSPLWLRESCISSRLTRTAAHSTPKTRTRRRLGHSRLWNAPSCSRTVRRSPRSSSSRWLAATA